MCNAVGRMFEDPIPQPKQVSKTAEDKIEWDRLWNETLWKVSELRKEYDNNYNNLMGMKG